MPILEILEIGCLIEVYHLLNIGSLKVLCRHGKLSILLNVHYSIITQLSDLCLVTVVATVCHKPKLRNSRVSSTGCCKVTSKPHYQPYKMTNKFKFKSR